MKKQGGKNNIKGINFQILSAFALFLQFLKNPDFSYIHLETPESNDFNLVFKDGHKIICEAKNYSNNLLDSHIKEILSKLIKTKSINEKDEILIICKNYRTKTFQEVSYLKYYPKEFTKVFKEKGYSLDLIKHIGQIKAWKSEEEILRKIIYILIFELTGFWLPDYGVEKIINDIAYKVFIEGSAKGLVYKREDIIAEIKSIAQQKLEESESFNELNTQREQIEKIVATIDEDKPLRGYADISALTQKPGLMYLLLDKLKDKQNLMLEKWDRILKASNVGIYPCRLYELFENNLEDEANRNYVLKYLSDEIERFSTYYRDNFFEHNISDILNKIIEIDKRRCVKAFDIIRNCFNLYGEELFYIESRDNKFYKRADLSKTLKLIFEKSNKINRSKIIEFIFDSFNLIADGEDHNHYTPIEIFEIINKYITSNIRFYKRRFGVYVKVLAGQFDRFEKFSSKMDFKGWELIGTAGSYWGNNYRVFDRCFVKSLTKILYYLEDKTRWEFIKDNCIFDDKQVDIDSPDFLRRASIPIILDEFKKNDEEAQKILKKLIFSKGIPPKVDLIYQNIYLGDFSENQKLESVELSLKKTKLPITPFIEMIISDLAKKGVVKAQDVLKEWLEDPKYLNRQFFMGKRNIIENLKNLFESSQKKAISIVKNLFLDRNFIDSFDTFDIDECCKLLSEVLNNDFEAGLEIVNSIYRKEELSRNQQILIINSFNNLGEQKNNMPKKREVIIKTYKNFLKLILLELDTNTNIENKFSYHHSRESIVKFAEKLATIGKFDEALFIVRKLINDSDPPRNGENYEDDPNGDFNYHNKIKNGEKVITINTVRGWIPWVLQKFITIKGRDYIEKVIPLINKLLKDDNYYVRVQALVPFIELVKSRNNCLTNEKERFLGIKLAEIIENIAFKILEDKENQTIVAFMSYLGKAFSFIRSLNEKRVSQVLHTFLNLKDKLNVSSAKQQRIEAYEDIIKGLETTIIFFAEFRKDTFNDEKYKYIYLDKWEDLKKFDDKPFKKLLINLLENSTSGIRASFAYRFSYEAPDDCFSMSYNYLKILAKNYNSNVYEYIYHFVEKYISVHFDACFDLYTFSLLREREFIKENINENNQSEMYWWPYFYNGKILENIFQEKGKNEFLKWLDFLLDYPKEVLVANDLDKAVNILKTLSHDVIKKNELIDKLIERNPGKYYDLKYND